MTDRIILLKYGELILKGANRRYFEDLLMKRVKERLKPIGSFSVRYMQSTVYIVPEDESTTDRAFSELMTVFGVASLCIAYRAEKNLDSMLQTVREKIIPELGGIKRFRADAKRSDKKFALTSPEIAGEIGAQVLSIRHDLKVDLYDPEVVIMAEVRDDGAYIHAGREKGAGGMPYGSSGRALLMLSGGIDSPVAGYMMARRGALIESLHFESYPYTSERAREKVMRLASLLCRYTDYMRVNVVSLTDLQLEIKDKCREEYFTILLRRFMIRIANIVARERSCGALVTGESLAQVASQTMAALAVTDSVAEVPILRPCIGMDKDDIVVLSRKINTFDTSILPYEDCCTVFTPRHPKLKPELDKVLEEEAKLDCDRLIAEALQSLKAETVHFDRI